MNIPPTIPAKYLPPRFPLSVTVLWVTVLGYWGAPGWLYGVLGVLLSILWVSYFIWLFKAKEIKGQFDIGDE